MTITPQILPSCHAPSPCAGIVSYRGSAAVVMMTAELAGLDRKSLARPIGNLRHRHSEIIAARDILFPGV